MPDQPNELWLSFSQWYTRLMFTAYFTGVREALHPGEKPLGIDELVGKPVRINKLKQLINRVLKRNKK